MVFAISKFVLTWNVYLELHQNLQSCLLVKIYSVYSEMEILAPWGFLIRKKYNEQKKDSIALYFSSDYPKGCMQGLDELEIVGRNHLDWNWEHFYAS